MSRKGQTLRELLAPLREKYFISGEINTKVGDMDEGRRRRSTAWRRKYTDGQVYTLDGISVEFPDWHFNVRAVEHRAAAPAEPGGDDAGDDGREARRGAGVHPGMASVDLGGFAPEALRRRSRGPAGRRPLRRLTR